ncbi:MAG TPA: hypothetical protein VN729_07380 [Ktedonobacteraceae bacterium]|nr:hypothetical protein [Ktedonobacteraceae bacterium]
MCVATLLARVVSGHDSRPETTRASSVATHTDGHEPGIVSIHHDLA